MDSKPKVSRSLPPLVEGKVHGYLKLVIDEVVWNKKSPGNVIVLATWWGEPDSAVFNPADLKTTDIRPEEAILKTYAIKTNLDLFKEYLRNSDTVELVVMSEQNHEIIGTAKIINLLEIFSGKTYFQYFPIVNEHGYKIGDIHVSLKITNIQKHLQSPLKSSGSKKKIIESMKTFNEQFMSPSLKFMDCDSQFRTKNDLDYQYTMPLSAKNFQNQNIYRSVIKDKRHDYEPSRSKFDSDVTDKLVAQVVARAQRLRGVLLSEANEDDPMGLLENLTSDSFQSDGSAENEATLYEYVIGNDMSKRSEKKSLRTLRSNSPTSSLINFGVETMRSCNTNVPSDINRCTHKIKKENAVDDLEDKYASNQLSIQPKIASPVDYVDSLRIAVDSLTLSSAGYRRVKSSCLPRGDGAPASITYFVQYDPMFSNIKKLNRKVINESKPIKMTSKRQVGQVIYFNHEAVYDLPKSQLHMDMPLKFKIFNRHLNQRTPTELGVGSVYIGDAFRSKSLSSTQRLAMVKKGIKIGELQVTIELGCDKIHFGKQFVEAVTSAKENIPVLELSSNSSITSTQRFKTATGTETNKSNNRVCTSSGKQENSWHLKESDNSRNSRESNDKKAKNNQRLIQIKTPKYPEEKILLHGLIWIAEGKDLPSTSTYLVCRAFWREDRASSRVCSDTRNPFYQFHQIVPLIHGPELLERTKDNCIITEVYSKNPSGEDILIGIAKLSVHQLYVAFRDPLVLPHLLKSKYPVISVDGWIAISDPVSGRLCGQILALVALGTADQIALLEMTRGLRDSSVTPRTIFNCARNPEAINQPSNPVNSINLIHNPVQDISQDKRETNKITQECQTEISTVLESKTQKNLTENSNCKEDSDVLHAIVDRLAQALSVPKTISNQEAQTSFDDPSRQTDKLQSTRKIEPLCLQASNSHSFCEDSCNIDSPQDNFNPSREMYRSVGVGAEFDEPVYQPTTSYANQNTQGEKVSTGVSLLSISKANSQSKKRDDDDDDDDNDDDDENHFNSARKSFENIESESEVPNVEEGAFRAVVEIDCALHLPKVETLEEAIEPSTYVTFQKVRSKTADRISSYMMTDVCPFSCNPKYDWRCDTKLSTDLLINDEKRLIMKMWRLIDPENSMAINLEKDIVIGFSAIDLSILTAGFPTVSGWFHIMDFSGKCNGQMKISITPLDNISTFYKNGGNSARVPLPTFNHSNISSPYPLIGEQSAEDHQENIEETATAQSQIGSEPALDIGLGLGEASMSFLSSSLKQKLTELDEIKKRLQSRLEDVTSNAFDDDFDNDFDLPENDINHESNDNNGNTKTNQPWLMPQIIDNSEKQGTSRSTNRVLNGNHCSTSENESNFQFPQQVLSENNTISIDANLTDTGYSSSSNIRGTQTSMNGNHPSYQNRLENHFQLQSMEGTIANGFTHDLRFNMNRNLNGHSNAKNGDRSTPSLSTSDLNTQAPNDRFSETDYPIRGTRMHISHLLDKLSTQLTAAPPPIANLPMKRNIMDLISSLRRNNNNLSNDVKCNREVNVRTVPTQTDPNFVDSHRPENNPAEPSVNTEDEIPAKTQRREKISTVIREEIISDNQNDSVEYDDLSTHLMASNVRHMDINTILHPLLYPHILPDTSRSNERQRDSNESITSNGEAIDILDSRYTETFSATINKSLCRLRNLTEVDISRGQHSRFSDFENTEVFRVTPSGVSENVDGNIDVTVIHKPCNDDLMASNSMESTTTISLDINTQTGTEIDDNSSLNSSETSVSNVSRQAPDGGNPIEDPSKIIPTKRNDHSGNSSSTS